MTAVLWGRFSSIHWLFRHSLTHLNSFSLALALSLSQVHTSLHTHLPSLHHKHTHASVSQWKHQLTSEGCGKLSHGSVRQLPSSHKLLQNNTTNKPWALILTLTRSLTHSTSEKQHKWLDDTPIRDKEEETFEWITSDLQKTSCERKDKTSLQINSHFLT